VKVHNIGSEDAENVDIYLYEDLDGGLRQLGGALDVTIPAPSGMEPSIVEIDLTAWHEPWIGEVVIKIDPEDEVLEISESNNELRGCWDLEGINVTEMDMPIEMNGTIPIVEVYEDDDRTAGFEQNEHIGYVGASMELAPAAGSRVGAANNSGRGRLHPIHLDPARP